MKHDGFSIKTAARESGVTPFVIRAWERRYNIIIPVRTPTNQRRYTRSNIQILTKLGKLVNNGYRIGDIAPLAEEEIDRLIAGIGKGLGGGDSAGFSVGSSVGSSGFAGESRLQEIGWPALGDSMESAYMNQSIAFIRDMNEAGLETLLSRVSISMTIPDFLEKLIMPLMRLIGDKWHSGEFGIGQEHMATWVIRSILSGLLRLHRHLGEAPMMVVATPAGQFHETGAMAVAISGAHCAWDITYLGTDLPAEDIAAMTLKTQAKLVALSIVYPSDDPRIPDELSRLIHLIPRQVAVVAGGAAVFAYKQVLDSLGIITQDSLVEFRNYLRRYRMILSDQRV